MCCSPLPNRQPFHVWHLAAVNGQSKLFERIGFGTFDGDAADLVDHLLELVEVDDRDVVDLHARPVSASIVLIVSAGPPN